jgi:hypothetical protein
MSVTSALGQPYALLWVLDVANSNSVAHRRKVGGTWRSRWPLPNVGQVSGQSSGRHEACVHKPSVTDKINLTRRARDLPLAGVRNSVRNQCPETFVTELGFGA